MGLKALIRQSITCRASAGVWSGVSCSTGPPLFHPLSGVRGQPYLPYNTLSKAKRGEKFVAPNLLILPTLGPLMLYFRKPIPRESALIGVPPQLLSIGHRQSVEN
jgi:hypothetical protein